MVNINPASRWLPAAGAGPARLARAERFDLRARPIFDNLKMKSETLNWPARADLQPTADRDWDPRVHPG
jgi:hypothetical protein